MTAHVAPARMSMSVFRLTDDVPAMISFLETVGLVLRSTSERTEGGRTAYAVLAGRDGRVALHATTDANVVGHTNLVLDDDEFDTTLAALSAAGFPVTQWDEAFGRAGRITTPRGDLWINDNAAGDNYGYRSHDDAEPGPIDVEGVLFSGNLSNDRRLFRSLGFRALGPDDEQGQTWSAPAGGLVHLHPVADGHPTADDWSVSLGFETDQNLGELATRLQAAGHDARLGEWGITVTDPDGQEVQIFPTAPRDPVPMRASTKTDSIRAVTLMVPHPADLAHRMARAYGWRAEVHGDAFAELTTGDGAVLWLNVVDGPVPSLDAVVIHCFVDDVTAACERARAAGAEILREPEVMPFGLESAYARLPGGPVVDLTRPV